MCHGYGQLASEFISYFHCLDDGTRLIVAPEALSRFYLFVDRGKVGASWMTKEDRLTEINDYIKYLNQTYNLIISKLGNSNLRINILGFSQGVATAMRWVCRSRIFAHRLILWGGNFTPENNFQATQDLFERTKLVIVTGNDDQYINREEQVQQLSELKQDNISFEHMHYNGGHYIDSSILEELSVENS